MRTGVGGASGRTPGQRRPVAIAALTAVALVVAGTAPAESRPIGPTSPRVASSPSSASEVDVSVLTPNGADVYEVSGDASEVVVVAPVSNHDTNLRIAVVPRNAPTSPDQGACMTWRGPSGPLTQPGVVLRHSNENGRLRAIMVTQNVWYSARQNLNVHVVDSGAPSLLDHVEGVSASASLGSFPWMHSFPWRFCARIRGSEVDVKAWPVGAPVPAWGEPGSGGTVVVPDTAPATGRPGGYFGHLEPGETTSGGDIDVWEEGLGAVVDRATTLFHSLAHRLATAM